MNPFQIEYNGIILNAESQYTVTDLQGVEGLPVRVSEDLKTGDHGGNIWARKYDMRTIAIEGVIRGSSISDFFTQKNAFVRAFSITDGDLLTITMWDGTTRTIRAKVIVPPMIPHTTGRNTFVNYRVELKCQDPFFMDEEVFTDTAVLTDDSGFPVPMPVPSPVGSTGDDDVIMVNNTGDVPAYASFRIENACENPTVTNNTTGQSFTIDDTLVDGDVVEVYYGQGGLFVLKNGINIMSDFEGDMPYMALGLNEIIFSASDYSATALLTVTYSNKYLLIG